MMAAHRVVVYTGGDGLIGFGHVRRMLTLARALAKARAEVTFVIRGDAAAREVREAAFQVVDVTTDPARAQDEIRSRRPVLALVDLKDEGTGLLRDVRAAAGWLGVVDDLGDRVLEADLILNSTVYAEELPYPRDRGTILLLGPRFALLREEFAREPIRVVSHTVRRVLVTVGGSDPTNLTPRLIQWVRAEVPHAHVTAVAGPFFHNLADVKAAGADALVENPSDIRSLMLEADLALSGGGQTTYELAASATPAVAIEVADDQRRNLEALAGAGVLVYAGSAADPDLQGSVCRHLRGLVDAPEERVRLGRSGRALVDGHGAERTAVAMLHRS